ncbi:MAG: hypothetical protein GWP59_06030 [Chlamydiales bacterium]|nr:hypothetical protein [Chlamydiales bacterium]
MVVKKKNIKAKIDTILAQNLLAKSYVHKPSLPQNLIKFLKQNIRSLRSKKLCLEDKLKNIQQVLDCIHEHTKEALKTCEQKDIESLVLWRRAWVFEIICKEFSRLNFQAHNKKTHIHIPLEILDNSKQNYRFIKAKHVLIHRLELNSFKAKGHPFYVLIPKAKKRYENLPSICLFPGTNFRKISSILESSDTKGPGRTLYDCSKNSLACLLKSSSSMRLLGYSQGGAVALRTIVDFPKYICQDPSFPSITFNAPGLEKDMLDQYQQNEHAGKNHSHLLQFTTYADPVSKVGKLMGDVYEINSHNFRDSGIPWRHHIGCKSYENKSLIARVDVEKENRCRVRKRYASLISFIKYYNDKLKQSRTKNILHIVKQALTVSAKQ